eukprot:3274133-Amphidinium_carterae.1
MKPQPSSQVLECNMLSFDHRTIVIADSKLRQHVHCSPPEPSSHFKALHAERPYFFPATSMTVKLDRDNAHAHCKAELLCPTR